MIPFLFFSVFAFILLFSFEAVFEFRGIGKGVDPVDRRVPGVIFFFSFCLVIHIVTVLEFFSFG